jgi:hypothetical protein
MNEGASMISYPVKVPASTAGEVYSTIQDRVSGAIYQIR